MAGETGGEGGRERTRAGASGGDGAGGERTNGVTSRACSRRMTLVGAALLLLLLLLGALFSAAASAPRPESCCTPPAGRATPFTAEQYGQRQCSELLDDWKTPRHWKHLTCGACGPAPVTCSRAACGDRLRLPGSSVVEEALPMVSLPERSSASRNRSGVGREHARLFSFT